MASQHTRIFTSQIDVLSRLGKVHIGKVCLQLFGALLILLVTPHFNTTSAAQSPIPPIKEIILAPTTKPLISNTTNQVLTDNLANKPVTEITLSTGQSTKQSLSAPQAKENPTNKNVVTYGLASTAKTTGERAPKPEKKPIASSTQRLPKQKTTALSEPLEMLQSLLRIDSQLEGSDREQNQKKIVALLQTITPLEIALLRESNTSTAVDGWVRLANILNNNIDRRRLALRSWRTLFATHPIMPTLLQEYSGEAQGKYRQIALLLPMTSKLGKAAKAFHDGFMNAYDESFIADKPEVVLYDVGEESFLLPSYYQAAITDGADFIVGPLGKEQTKSLLNSVQPEQDTLVIADIPAEKATTNLYGISLLPEEQARDSAERAFLEGHRNVSILQSDSEWANRVADAFRQQWEQLGGKVINSVSHASDINASSLAVKKLLGIRESVLRHKILETQLGINLRFSSRRNDDMDFIFLASTGNDARQTASQLRFFKAHDLPIYATPYVYDGYPNPGLDADLNGVIFGETPWIVNGANNYKEQKALEKKIRQQQKLVDAENALTQQNTSDLAEPTSGITVDVNDDQQLENIDNTQLAVSDSASAPETTPKIATIQKTYDNSPLDRLYALGVQSYQLIPRLQALREQPSSQYVGEAMTSSVKSDGNIEHHPTWVRFKSGLINTIPLTKNSS